MKFILALMIFAFVQNVTFGKSFKNRGDQENILRPKREVIERSRLRKYVDLSKQQQFKVMDIEGRSPPQNTDDEQDRKKRDNEQNMDVGIDESIARVKRSPKMTRDMGYLTFEDDGDEKIGEQNKKGSAHQKSKTAVPSRR